MGRNVRLFISAFFVVVVAGVALAAAAATASTQQGVSNTVMKSLVGLSLNGSRNPAKDAACRATFGHLLGTAARTVYDITPQTESARVRYQGATYDLNPLGLAGSYSFGKYFKPPSQPLNAYGVLYSISNAFTNPVNTFVLVLDPATNCLLSSTA